MNDYLLAGIPPADDPRGPFFKHQADPSKIFSVGEFGSEQAARQAATDYGQSVMAHRAQLAGRALTDKELIFGPEKRDPRPVEKRQVAKMALEQFDLTPPPKPETKKEKALRQAQELAAEARRNAMTTEERGVYDAQRELDLEQEQIERAEAAAKHLASPLVSQTLIALGDMELIRRFRDEYTAEDVEQIAFARKAISNPDYGVAGVEFVQAFFAADKARRTVANAEKRKWLQTEEDRLATIKATLNVPIPESQRVAESIVNSQVVE